MSKKQDETNEDKCPLEPFVVNIPDNISRIDIDQYLKNVQDQRRKGLNYSYNTDDEDGGEDEELMDERVIESQETEQKIQEPWNEVSRRSIFFDHYFRVIFLYLVKTLAFII